MTHRYFAAPDSGLDDRAAEVLGSRFSALRRAGEVSPARVVEDARPPESPTHPFFEWNDLKAAEEYRRGQAGHYLASVYVIPDGAESAPVNVRVARVSAETAAERAETPRYSVPSVDVDEDTLSGQARAELRAWHEKYGASPALRPAAVWVREALGALGELVRRGDR